MLLSRDYERFISNQILYIAVGYLSLFGILGYSVMAQTVIVSYEVSWKPPSGNTDPVVTVSCMVYDLPSGHTDLTYQWEFNGIVLSNNDALVDADPSRFSVEDDGKELYIRNAVIVDEGWYTCRVIYRLANRELKTLSNKVLVSITTYLPPLNYPQCSISPDTGITVGSEINLICDSGISLSSLSMPMVTLLIHRPDGTSTFSSPGMVTWTVREEDDMAQFTCTMESSTFPTALRTCSAIFNATTTPPTPKIRTSSIPDESHTTSTIIQGGSRLSGWSSFASGSMTTTLSATSSTFSTTRVKQPPHTPTISLGNIENGSEGNSDTDIGLVVAGIALGGLLLSIIVIIALAGALAVYIRSRLRNLKQRIAAIADTNRPNMAAAGHVVPLVGIDNPALNRTETVPQHRVEETDYAYASVGGPDIADQSGYEGINLAEVEREREYQGLGANP